MTTGRLALVTGATLVAFAVGCDSDSESTDGDPSRAAEKKAACTTSRTKTTEVRITHPWSDGLWSSPVRVTIEPKRPRGCDANYYITIDGRPYEQLPKDRSQPVSRTNPHLVRPVKQGRGSSACVSIGKNWLSVPLAPGTHTLAVRGDCPRGTEVPRTLPTSRRFIVKGAPPREECGDIEDISKWPNVAGNIKVRGIDCAYARAFVLARAKDCRVGSCAPDGFRCEGYAGAGSLEVLCVNKRKSITWIFAGGY